MSISVFWVFHQTQHGYLFVFHAGYLWSICQESPAFLDETAITRPDLDIREYLSVWSVALTTVRTVKGSTPPDPSPQLAGDLLRAVLTGGRYPATLLNGVTLRIRAEQTVTRGRAAVIKAYYLRNYPTELNKEVYTVSLNETTNVPYLLGRLFSVLEAVQKLPTPASTLPSRTGISTPPAPRRVCPFPPCCG